MVAKAEQVLGPIGGVEGGQGSLQRGFRRAERRQVVGDLGRVHVAGQVLQGFERGQ